MLEGIKKSTGISSKVCSCLTPVGWVPDLAPTRIKQLLNMNEWNPASTHMHIIELIILPTIHLHNIVLHGLNLHTGTWLALIIYDAVKVTTEFFSCEMLNKQNFLQSVYSNCLKVFKHENNYFSAILGMERGGFQSIPCLLQFHNQWAEIL